MATQFPLPIIHYFDEINVGKYNSVKHFELSKVENGKPQLSTTINIQKDRKFALSFPDYWLKVRQGKKWSKPITGFFKTQHPFLFKGDIEFKKHLVVLNINDSSNEVLIYYFPNFYLKDADELLNKIHRNLP